MRRKRFLAPLFAALFVFPSATAVAANETTFIGIFGCHLGGGVHEVEGGTDVVLTSGWGATNRGLVEAFVNGGGAFVLTVNGATVDLSDWTSGPERRDDGIWFVTFAYPAGTVEADAPLDVELDIVLNHVLYDGLERFRPGTITLECLVVAT